MPTFRKFEEIEAWKKACEVIRQIYTLSKSGGLSKDYSLRDQIRRASVSVIANIAEGFGRNSEVEVQSPLYVALDQGYIEKQTFNNLYHACSEISGMCKTLAQHLRL
ncbi:MAG TPA: four helix bundle protein [Blastocatellia bacterium]|nr:four helix bundle protein [Blastocatellia bacterium]